MTNIVFGHHEVSRMLVDEFPFHVQHAITYSNKLKLIRFWLRSLVAKRNKRHFEKNILNSW